MRRRFENKTVLITGGAGALARAAAKAFAAEGATVVLAGRTQDSLTEAANETGAAGTVRADLTDPAQAESLIAQVVATYGRLDVAVNAAGTLGTLAPLAELPDETWRNVVDTNLNGVFNAMKHQINAMKGAGGGTIVNVSSNIGPHTRRPGLSAYAASKAAVSVLTRNAAREYIGEGVRINAVSPGASDTPMSYRPGESREDRDARVKAAVPAGRVSTPQEVAEAVLWLASEESSFVVGTDLVVDGGATA